MFYKGHMAKWYFIPSKFAFSVQWYRNSAPSESKIIKYPKKVLQNTFFAIPSFHVIIKSYFQFPIVTVPGTALNPVFP